MTSVGSALDAVTRWPVTAVAAGVVDTTGVLAAVGDHVRPFAWASVTKLLTALAVLVAVEEETVTLDRPAGPSGSTVAHLLAHASGLDPTGDRVLAEPGTRRIYSNAGYEVVARLVGRLAAMPFGDYLAGAVLEPLGLSATTVEGSPASGAVGPLDDLLVLGTELLAPTLVSPATLATAATTAFPGIAGVVPGLGSYDPNDWGLGPELRAAKAPHWTGASNSPATFGHFGRAGGFLWVDPVAGLGCAALGDRDFGPWALEAWPALSDAVLAEFAVPR